MKDEKIVRVHVRTTMFWKFTHQVSVLYTISILLALEIFSMLNGCSALSSFVAPPVRSQHHRIRERSSTLLYQESGQNGDINENESSTLISKSGNTKISRREATIIGIGGIGKSGIILHFSINSMG